MFERILVPLDGSKLAERSLPHAEFFARVFGSQIVLLQVLDPTPFNETPNVIEPLNWQIRKVEADRYLQGMADQLRDKKFKVEHVLKEGRAPENIIDFAHAETVDLVILCTHGASGLSRWNTSSVVEKVISKIYMPVLLIRSYQEEPAAVEETATAAQASTQTESHPTVPENGNASSASVSPYRRILLPIDTSRRAECSLPAAVSIAQGISQNSGQEKTEGQAPLLLAAVLQPPELPIPTPYSAEINQLINDLMEASRDAVQRYLNELQQHMTVQCEARVVENESIPNAIHTMVEQDNIDLVVLCAHGQSGQINWPYGSVARNYLEHGEKHVLVIQDVPASQIRPTTAEVAAQKSGRR